MIRKKSQASRREFLSAAGALAAGGSVALPGARVFAQGNGSDRKYIFTICAAGGASIIDAFMAQASGPAAYTTGLVQPAGSPLRAVGPLQNSIQGAVPLGNGYSQATFLSKFGADTAVMTCEVSSVNHLIAAKRSITGDNVNAGRTIAEAVAASFGKGLVVPNMTLAGGGYAAQGDDDTLPAVFRGQFIADPLMFAFAAHGFKGKTALLGPTEMRAARELRAQLETVSRFQQQFKGSKVLEAYQSNRERVVEALEKGDMATKLMLLDPATNNLAQFGYQVSADINLVREKFPAMATDPFESRLALGFLAAKNGLSNAITIAPGASPLITAAGSPNAPLAFDWSHVDHRGAQNSMWSYILKGIDGLIDLLKATDVDGDPAKGKMWDRSMIYIATEFGRDKVGTGASGHHLNNGVVMISPMIQGNKVFGGIDAATALTFGFDPASGTPDPIRKMNERDVYSAIAHAMGISFAGRRDFPAMVRKV